MRFTTFGSAVGAFITLLPSEQANAIRFAEPAHYLDTCPDLQLAQIGTDADAYAEVYAEAEGRRKDDLYTALKKLDQALNVERYKYKVAEESKEAAQYCNATSDPFNKKKHIFTDSVVIALKNLEAAAQEFYTNIGFQKPYTFNQGIVYEQHEAHLEHVQQELSKLSKGAFYTMKAYDNKTGEFIGLRDVVYEAVMLLSNFSKDKAKKKENVEEALKITATLTSYLKTAFWAPEDSNFRAEGKFQLAGPAADDLYTYCFAQWCAQREALSKGGKYIDSTRECGGGAARAGWSAADLRAALKP